MASRRTLKKTVNYIVSEMCVEALVLKHIKNVPDDQCDEVLTDILNLQNEFVTRTSHTEPGNVKGYYRQFYKDFNAGVDAISAKIDKF